MNSLKMMCGVLIGLGLLVSGAASSVEIEPQIHSRFGGPSGEQDLSCYLAGRWVSEDLGTAVTTVDGTRVDGVMRKFDDSLRENLFEMTFEAEILSDGAMARGQQRYTFLTGSRFSYSGSIELRLSPDYSRLDVAYGNGFSTLKDTYLKVLSGECR